MLPGKNQKKPLKKEDRFNIMLPGERNKIKSNDIHRIDLQKIGGSSKERMGGQKRIWELNGLNQVMGNSSSRGGDVYRVIKGN